MLASRIRSTYHFIDLQFSRLLYTPIANVANSTICVMFTKVPDRIRGLTSEMFRQLRITRIRGPRSISTILVNGYRLLP